MSHKPPLPPPMPKEPLEPANHPPPPPPPLPSFDQAPPPLPPPPPPASASYAPPPPPPQSYNDPIQLPPPLPPGDQAPASKATIQKRGAAYLGAFHSSPAPQPLFRGGTLLDSRSQIGHSSLETQHQLQARERLLSPTGIRGGALFQTGLSLPQRGGVCDTKLQPHPPSQEQNHNQKFLNTANHPRPLFDMRPDTRPNTPPSHSRTSAANAYHQSPTSEPRPLFENLPPKQFQRPPCLPSDGLSDRPRSQHPSTGTSPAPAWPRPPGHRFLNQNQEWDSDNWEQNRESCQGGCYQDSYGGDCNQDSYRDGHDQHSYGQGHDQDMYEDGRNEDSYEGDFLQHDTGTYRKEFKHCLPESKEYSDYERTHHENERYDRPTEWPKGSGMFPMERKNQRPVQSGRNIGPSADDFRGEEMRGGWENMRLDERHEGFGRRTEFDSRADAIVTSDGITGTRPLLPAFAAGVESTAEEPHSSRPPAFAAGVVNEKEREKKPLSSQPPAFAAGVEEEVEKEKRVGNFGRLDSGLREGEKSLASKQSLNHSDRFSSDYFEEDHPGSFADYDRSGEEGRRADECYYEDHYSSHGSEHGEQFSERDYDSYSGCPDWFSGHSQQDVSHPGHYTEDHFFDHPDQQRYGDHDYPYHDRLRDRNFPSRHGERDVDYSGLDKEYDDHWREERNFNPQKGRAYLLDRPKPRPPMAPVNSWDPPDHRHLPHDPYFSPRVPFREQPSRPFMEHSRQYVERLHEGEGYPVNRPHDAGGGVSGPPREIIKPKVVSVDKILDYPGRKERPSHIVIILRGLPGSGKSHIAKLIKDKEISNGGQLPRILSLDAYFVNEVEKTEKDPDTGRRVKKKVEEYEYDEALEPAFRKSLFKTFNKTLEEGFFPMIIVDAVNHKMCHFDKYWSNAKVKGFEVYVVELMEPVGLCVERNTHKRTREEIEKLAQQWEDTPIHFLRLDVAPLLSDSNIDEIEMECETSDGEEQLPDVSKVNSAEDVEQAVVKSRWEDASEDKLDKLDAVGSIRRKKRHLSEVEMEEEELSLTEYLARKMKGDTGPQKKRVRWADLEAAKEEQRRKEIGFVIGSGWSKVSEEEAQKLLLGKTNTTQTT